MCGFVFVVIATIRKSMLIILNGSINAGKTTTARKICELLARTAHVEVDSLREFISWMPLEESLPLNLETAVAVTKIFLARGLNVVLSYPLRREDHTWMQQQFAEMSDVHFFTLRPPMQISQSQRGERVLSEWEVGRIAYHYHTKDANPDIGKVIDNSQMTPEETARLILRETGML
jgi:chloramphenicol 3-O-phosphotransferase